MVLGTFNLYCWSFRVFLIVMFIVAILEIFYLLDLFYLLIFQLNVKIYFINALFICIMILEWYKMKKTNENENAITKAIDINGLKLNNIVGSDP